MVYSTIKYFKHMLEGRLFTIYTVHKPLTTAFVQRLDKAIPRQVRNLNYTYQPILYRYTVYSGQIVYRELKPSIF